MLYAQQDTLDASVPTAPKKTTVQTPQEFKTSQPREIRWLLGGFVGLNMLSHNAQFNTIQGAPTCCGQDFGVFSSLGFTGGGLLEYQFSPLLRLQTRLAASYWSAHFRRDLPTNYLNNGNDPPILLTSEHSIDASQLTLSLEPALSIRAVAGLFVELGASVAFSLSSSYEQRETLLQPDNIFWNDTKSKLRNVASGTLPAASSLAITPFAGVSYEIPLSEHLFVTPFARYYLPLSDVAQTERIVRAATTGNPTRDVQTGSWRISTLQFGVAVKLGIRKPLREEITYIRDTSTVVNDANDFSVRLVSSKSETKTVNKYGLELDETTIRESYLREIPRHSSLALDVNVVGIATNGERQQNPTIVVEEFESEDYKPLLPYLFFPDGNDSLALTRQHLLSSTKEAAKWSDNDVVGDALDVFNDLLNVLGYRMKKSPESKLTIVGANSNTGIETGDTALSMRRAQAVAQYLTKIWGINTKRLTLKAQNLPDRRARIDTPDGMEENRRVELIATPVTLLAPLVDDDVSREVTPPTLEITPSIATGAGLNWWYMFIKQRGNVLKQYSGSEMPKPQLFNMGANLVREEEIPLVITLQAADAAGKQGNVSKQVTVKQITLKKKRIELVDDKRIDRFSFIMFDYDKSIVDAENTKNLLEEVKKKIEPTSTVTIAGYGDRSGSRDYNRELAARRSAEVQKLLQVPENQLVIKPVGNARLLQDNNLPEGRAYSRIVQIIIETPIKAGTPPKKRKK